jgi:hypothetical protein
MEKQCNTSRISARNPMLSRLAKSSEFCLHDEYPFISVPTVVHYAKSNHLIGPEPLTKLPGIFAKFEGWPAA